jgi:hypothetical protein
MSKSKTSEMSMKSKQEEEIERLEDEAREAGIEASRLENRLQDIPRIVDKLQHELNEQKIKRDRAITQLRKVKPITLPPVPSMEEMMKMARSQCPDRDPAVLKRLAGALHASAVTGSNAGESYYPRGDDGMGGDARVVGDSHYDIPPPPPGPGLSVDLPKPPEPRIKIKYG